MTSPNNISNQFLRMLSATRSDELDCDSCFDQLDQFVELELAGLNATEALPLVSHHLSMCKDCRDEFEALRQVVESMDERWVVPSFLARLLKKLLPKGQKVNFRTG